MRVDRSSLVCTLAAALAAIGLQAVASAQGTIYACVSSRTGQMRCPGTTPGTCLKTEYLVSWAIQGSQGPQGPPGDANGLTERVAALENNNRWAHFVGVVHCGAGESVAAALEQAAAYASSEIGVEGFCNENVIVRGNRTYLYGLGTGAGPTGPASGGALVEIAASGAVLGDLTLAGGVHVGGNCSVRFSRTTMTGSAAHGIYVGDSGHVALSHSAVLEANGTGVYADAGSRITLDDSSIVEPGRDAAAVRLEGHPEAPNLAGRRAVELVDSESAARVAATVGSPEPRAQACRPGPRGGPPRPRTCPRATFCPWEP